MNPEIATPIPRYAVSEIDGMLLPKPQPDGSWCRWSDVEARLAQLEQEQATLRSLLDLKRATAQHLLDVQQRIAIVIGDIPPCEHVDYSLPSLVAFVVMEHDEAVAALGETRQALQQLIEKYDALLSRVDTTGSADALVPQPRVGDTSTDR